MSGPLRPTAEDVLVALRTLKAALPPCKVWLSTWTDVPDTLRAEVDVVIVNPEPVVTTRARTRQMRKDPSSIAVLLDGLVKMIKGVEHILKVADCAPDDLVIRIRTDMHTTFSPGYLAELLEAAKRSYVVRKRTSSGIGFDDWFGITTFANMKQVWSFPDLDASMKEAWNGEDLIYRKVKNRIPITFIQEDKINCYILRPGGFKHYFP